MDTDILRGNKCNNVRNEAVGRSGSHERGQKSILVSQNKNDSIRERFKAAKLSTERIECQGLENRTDD